MKKLPLLVLSIIFVFCSVNCEPTQYNKDNMQLYTIAAFSVLYADEMGTSVEPLEEDLYGRILFRVKFGNTTFYEQESGNSENWIYAFMICQKSDDENTYYYEDECFRIYQRIDSFTESERRDLKEQNDWDQPLNQEKMTSRQIIRPGKNKLNATALGLSKGMDVELYLDEVFSQNYGSILNPIYKEYLDCDKMGRSIGAISGFYTNENGESIYEAYFIMVDRDSRVINISKVHDRMHYWSELKKFKQENGWE